MSRSRPMETSRPDRSPKLPESANPDRSLKGEPPSGGTPTREALQGPPLATIRTELGSLNLRFWTHQLCHQRNVVTKPGRYSRRRRRDGSSRLEVWHTSGSQWIPNEWAAYRAFATCVFRSRLSSANSQPVERTGRFFPTFPSSPRTTSSPHWNMPQRPCKNVNFRFGRPLETPHRRESVARRSRFSPQSRDRRCAREGERVDDSA